MSAHELPDTFTSFDRLPGAAYVSIAVVALLYGCATPTVWRRVARGLIPPPRKFGASARWNVGVLREELAKRPQAEAVEA
ncbi:transcriptional regulator [Paraburkholderia phymatum]|uniref:Uncharacterized protein n=1 Tax=Paraburkholderia phymatum (strain DSM 17167 / CIP 108236 / LMG 21445 / STM815) TaxID=391038 RepID=B2JV41_PARP8|nr:hypothetical protein [Paraburkholderia phymatum]ACC74818.1 conserved hypothetical protein [Paraburkholderia phymatum STM815]